MNQQPHVHNRYSSQNSVDSNAISDNPVSDNTNESVNHDSETTSSHDSKQQVKQMVQVNQSNVSVGDWLIVNVPCGQQKMKKFVGQVYEKLDQTTFKVRIKKA